MVSKRQKRREQAEQRRHELHLYWLNELNGYFLLHEGKELKDGMEWLDRNVAYQIREKPSRKSEYLLSLREFARKLAHAGKEGGFAMDEIPSKLRNQLGKFISLTLERYQSSLVESLS